MALTADLELEMRDAGGIRSVTMAASQTIYKGSFVNFNASGYAVPGADTASEVCAGIAVVKATSGATAGVDRVDVYTSGCFKVIGASLEQADVGRIMDVSDNAIIDVGTNNVNCGKLIEYISATSGWMELLAPGIAGVAGT